MGRAMISLLPAALFFTGCATLGGTTKVDPLAGWGGRWAGEYTSETGDVGTLQFEFSIDATGAPLGVAWFDTVGGPLPVRLSEPILTQDSIKTAMEGEGLYSELRGARTPAGAEGVYVVWPAGREQILDSGTWEVTAETTR